jgi:hypothetical protein
MYILAFIGILNAKLLVFIPGFGKPLIPEKLECLRNNISKLPSDADYWIFNYSDIPQTTEFPSNVKWIPNKGSIADRFLDYGNTDELKALGYTHIFIVLDDVRLNSWIIPEVEPTDFEIFSPVHSSTSNVNRFLHSDEIHNPDLSPMSVFSVQRLELFAYYMTINGFGHYLKFITRDNPWTWGMDFIIQRCVRMHPVVFNDWIFTHWKSGSSTPSTDKGRKQFREYLKLHGTTKEYEKQRKVSRSVYDLTNFEIRNKPAFTDGQEAEFQRDRKQWENTRRTNKIVGYTCGGVFGLSVISGVIFYRNKIGTGRANIHA